VFLGQRAYLVLQTADLLGGADRLGDWRNGGKSDWLHVTLRSF